MSAPHRVSIGFFAADGRETWTTTDVRGFGSSPKNDEAVKAQALTQTTPFVRSRLRYVEIDARPDGTGILPELWAASERIRAPRGYGVRI